MFTNTSSIERIYSRIEKLILLAQSYTEIKDLSFIIKSCRLKPYSYIFESRTLNLKLHSWWFDEFGNSFKINKKKNIQIIYNDLSLNRDKIICTDLYYGLSLDNVVKFSKLMYLGVGKDAFSKNCFFISFLGIDNYFRSYYFMDYEWRQISPLMLGMGRLLHIAQNVNINGCEEILIKEKLSAPCIIDREWITSMPISEDFLKLIQDKYDNFLFFNKEQ